MRVLIDYRPALREPSGVDRRIPGRVLTLAWHRLGWPAAPKDAHVLSYSTLEPLKNVVRRVYDTYQEAIERRGWRARSA